MIVDEPDVEVCLGKLSGEKSSDLRVSFLFIFAHTILEMFQCEIKFFSLKIQASQVEISFDIILIILQCLSVYLNQLSEYTHYLVLSLSSLTRTKLRCLARIAIFNLIVIQHVFEGGAELDAVSN